MIDNDKVSIHAPVRERLNHPAELEVDVVSIHAPVRERHWSVGIFCKCCPFQFTLP